MDWTKDLLHRVHSPCGRRAPGNLEVLSALIIYLIEISEPRLASSRNDHLVEQSLPSAVVLKVHLPYSRVINGNFSNPQY